MRGLIYGAVAMALGHGAWAEPLDTRAAGKALFSPRAVSVELVPHEGLTETEMQIVGEVAKQQLYYAAVAYSPGDGLVHEATLGATNYHAIAPAEADALAACDARKEAEAPCVVVARVLPKGWKPGRFQLSQEATDGFRRTYRRTRDEKALAISPGSNAWSIATGAGAAEQAVSQCNEQTGAADSQDCVLAVQN